MWQDVTKKRIPKFSHLLRGRRVGGHKKTKLCIYLIESLQFHLNINPLNHSLWTKCVHFTFNGFSGSFEAKSDILPKTCSSLSWCLSLWWLLSAACHNMHITVNQKPLLQPKLDPFVNTPISYKEETLKDHQKWNGGQAELCEEIVPQKNLGLLQKGSLCLQTHSNIPLRSSRRRRSPKKIAPNVHYITIHIPLRTRLKP